MSESPSGRARQLLAEAAHLDALTPAERTAGKILLHGRLVAILHELREYHEGHAEEHRALVLLVEQLLASIAVRPSDGSPQWWEEIPRRTGSAFRRAIAAIVAWFRGRA